MKIGGLEKLTLIDFPQKLAATIFISGCSFRCPFCYSPELVLEERIKSHPEISKEYLFKFLKQRKDFLEGVVICGGEPTIHEDLPDFIEKIKNLGYAVKLDTNGSNPEMLRKLIAKQLIDYVAMDIKAPQEKYSQIVGRQTDNNHDIINSVEKSINLLKKSQIEYEFRTTVVPTLIEKKDIIEITKWISPAKKYYLQNFRPEKTMDPKFVNIKSYPKEYLVEIQKAVSPLFEVCEARGV